MSILRWLLLPFGFIYFLIISIRNFLYDYKILKSYTFKPTVICVGNLSVGGTGKSPMIEHLIRMYKDEYKLAVLSRGYKRKTKGFIEVQTDMNALTVGDEPLQFKNKFEDVLICVDANRKRGIKKIMKHYPKTQMILLDDAFQHRSVKADFNIVMTTYSRPFFKDFILPIGRLREPRSGKKRANMFIVNKCPDFEDDKKIRYYKYRIGPKFHQKVILSKISYSEKVYNQTTEKDLDYIDNFCLVTGIADPEPLKVYLDSLNKTYNHLEFPDHHNFSDEDISKLNNIGKPIITTEKDYTRLKNQVKAELYYMPIRLVFDKDIKPYIHLKPQSL